MALALLFLLNQFISKKIKKTRLQKASGYSIYHFENISFLAFSDAVSFLSITSNK